MFRKKRDETTPTGTASKLESPGTVATSTSHHQSTTGQSGHSQSVVSQLGGHPVRTEGIDELIARRFGKPRSALGPGTVIQGKLSFDTVVIIEGKLGGEVFSSETLIVGKQGTMNAQVRVKHLVVAGVVTGSIVATDSIELLPGGRLDGDFATTRFIVAEGAIFNGTCRMSEASTESAAATVAAKPQSTSVTRQSSSPDQAKADQSKLAATEPPPAALSGAPGLTSAGIVASA